MTEINYTIRFTSRRCPNCNRFWLGEEGVTNWHCPYCARDVISDDYNKFATYERRIIGLKGALKRARKA